MKPQIFTETFGNGVTGQYTFKMQITNKEVYLFKMFTFYSCSYGGKNKNKNKKKQQKQLSEIPVSKTIQTKYF